MPGSLLQRNQLNVERGCLLSHYKSSDDSFNSCQNHLSRSQQGEQNSTLDKDENPALHKHCLSSSEQLPSLNYSVKTNQPTHHATTHLHSVIPSPLILQLTLRKSWCSSDRFMQTSKSWQSTHWCHSVSPSATQCHLLPHKLRDTDTLQNTQQQPALLCTRSPQNFKSTWDASTCNSTGTENKSGKEATSLKYLFY